MYEYQLEIHEEAAGVWLSCPDVPEFHAAGDTRQAAFDQAHDAMETALSFYVDGKRPMPVPRLDRVADHRAVLNLRALTVAKMALWDAMIAQGVSKAELARRLGVGRPHVDRLVDFLHASRLDGIEQALIALGRRISIAVEVAA